MRKCFKAELLCKFICQIAKHAQKNKLGKLHLAFGVVVLLFLLTINDFINKPVYSNQKVQSVNFHFKLNQYRIF